ncbi:desumoylating isopeptidase 1-like isoform X2 [Oryza brachyantha]|nr:desumoylating isopeptidase 1-like isoform X2 [Oryza brachyantha]
MAEDGYPVKLHIYDLSQGMARQLSTTILGKAIEAIWHTGMVVYGREYFFGGGIQKDHPGRTQFGTPVRVEDLGVTHVPREVFEDFLQEISPRYTPATYSLLSNNCNNFTNEAAQFLVGSAIPSYILELPNEVMNSPIGALILPMIQGLETSLRAGAAPQPPQFKPEAATHSPSSGIHVVQPKSTAAADNTDANDGGRIPPAVRPAPSAAAETSPKPVAVAEVSASAVTPAVVDPLREAKRRVQEEIKREFAAIMATGAVQAGEAAALATRRVMERHGLRRAAATATGGGIQRG